MAYRTKQTACLRPPSWVLDPGGGIWTEDLLFHILCRIQHQLFRQVQRGQRKLQRSEWEEALLISACHLFTDSAVECFKCHSESKMFCGNYMTQDLLKGFTFYTMKQQEWQSDSFSRAVFCCRRQICLLVFDLYIHLPRRDVCMVECFLLITKSCLKIQRAENICPWVLPFASDFSKNQARNERGRIKMIHKDQQLFGRTKQQKCPVAEGESGNGEKWHPALGRNVGLKLPLEERLTAWFAHQQPTSTSHLWEPLPLLRSWEDQAGWHDTNS